jgi:hypothetical protein
MNRLKALLVAAILAAVVVLVPRQAHALGPVGIELGAKVGYGTNPVSGSPENPMGVGLGGRGGVSIFGLYAGVAGLYYLGSSQTVDGDTVKIHSAVYGLEAGYGFKLLGLLTIRPQLGLGNDQIGGSSSSGGGSSKGYLYLEPAALVLVSIGIVYVGADIGALLLPSGPANKSTADGCTSASGCHSFDAGLTVHGQVGVNF